MKNPSSRELTPVASVHQKRRRFRVQYSVRLLLGLTLIVAVVLSCHVVRLQRARLQHESAAKVREMDGVVIYDYKFGESMEPIPFGVQSSSWACHMFGQDYCHDVVWVTLVGEEIKDRDIECLKELRGLKVLLLGPCSVSDAGLGVLCELRQLEYLEITSNQATAQGIAHLHARLPRCKMDVTLQNRGERYTFLVLPDPADSQ